MSKTNVYIKNRKASFDYEFLEEYETGIVLFGPEVKSIINGEVNISDAYCYINGGEVFIKNMHISPLKNASYNNHEPLRERKLLLKRNEINKLSLKLKNKGLTLVPTLLFTTKTGLIKLKINLAKGKKNYDKRESIKERDIERQIQRGDY